MRLMAGWGLNPVGLLILILKAELHYVTLDLANQKLYMVGSVGRAHIPFPSPSPSPSSSTITTGREPNVFRVTLHIPQRRDSH